MMSPQSDELVKALAKRKTAPGRKTYGRRRFKYRSASPSPTQAQIAEAEAAAAAATAAAMIHNTACSTQQQYPAPSSSPPSPSLAEREISQRSVLSSSAADNCSNRPRKSSEVSIVTARKRQCSPLTEEEDDSKIFGKRARLPTVRTYGGLKRRSLSLPLQSTSPSSLSSSPPSSPSLTQTHMSCNSSRATTRITSSQGILMPTLSISDSDFDSEAIVRSEIAQNPVSSSMQNIVDEKLLELRKHFADVDRSEFVEEQAVKWVTVDPTARLYPEQTPQAYGSLSRQKVSSLMVSFERFVEDN